MKTNFAASLKRVLVHEGGYSNHPADPGGATMWGIIQRVYDADRKKRGLKPQAVRKITAGERDAIYRSQYWNAVRADELPIGVDYCVFDGAVNSGPKQSGLWLQRALKSAGVYKGPVDGSIGAVTLAAVEAHPSPAKLVEAICDQRLAFLRRLRTWSVFGVGWSRRVSDVRTAAAAMAKSEPAPKPDKIPADKMAKGDERDIKVTETPEGKSGTEQTTSGVTGGIGATLLSYFDQASDWLSYVTALPEWLTRWIIGGVIIVTLAIAITLLARAGYGLVRLWLDKRALA